MEFRPVEVFGHTCSEKVAHQHGQADDRRHVILVYLRPDEKSVMNWDDDAYSESWLPVERIVWVIGRRWYQDNLVGFVMS